MQVWFSNITNLYINLFESCNMCKVEYGMIKCI